MKWDNDIEDLFQSQLLNAISLFKQEKNENATWGRLYEVANAIMKPFKDYGLVSDFKVVCDGRVNDQEAIDENELHMQVGIKLDGDEKFRPYHIALTQGDGWMSIITPPELIDEDCDFVNKV